MSKVYRRLRGAFQRYRSSRVREETPDRYDRRQTPTRDEKLSDKSKDEDADDEIESDQSRQTSLRGQTRRNIPSNPRPIPMRTIPNRVQTGLNTNTQVNPPPVTTTIPTTQTQVPISNEPSPQQLTNLTSHPSLYGLPSDTSPNQASLPPVDNITQAVPRQRISALMNRKRPPIRISRYSTLIDFPRNFNKEFYFPQHQNHLPASFQSQDTLFTNEYDYPVEKIIINGNIRPSMIRKINRTVDDDRFGPIQHHKRRYMENSHPYSIRYIREIPNPNSYSEKPLNQVQHLLDYTPPMTCTLEYHQSSFPMPVHHFTACALPNDPMRCY